MKNVPLVISPHLVHNARSLNESRFRCVVGIDVFLLNWTALAGLVTAACTDNIELVVCLCECAVLYILVILNHRFTQPFYKVAANSSTSPMYHRLSFSHH